MGPSSDLAGKVRFYNAHGVEEYYVYDPAKNEWALWLRGKLGLDCAEGLQEWVSPRLGVRFDFTQPELAIYHPDGAPFLTFLELTEQAEAAQKLVEQESQRAEQESQRAEQESQRAERLAARLRALGEDPDLL